jgi:hypothetical protein
MSKSILKIEDNYDFDLSSIFSKLQDYNIIDLSRVDLRREEENNLLYILKQKNIEFVDIKNTIYSRIEYKDFFDKLEEEHLCKLIIFLPEWLFSTCDKLIPKKHVEKVMKKHIEYYNTVDNSD